MLVMYIKTYKMSKGFLGISCAISGAYLYLPSVQYRCN